jgi:hypothetical protein
MGLANSPGSPAPLGGELPAKPVQAPFPPVPELSSRLCPWNLGKL